MDYNKVDSDDINYLINNGTLKELIAIKDVQVKAIELTQPVVDKILAAGGYKTVVIDEQGNSFVETTNKKINVGDFLVTNQISGYDNSYVVPSAKFLTLYNKAEGQDNYMPLANERKVYLIPENLNLVFEAPWGGDMKIRASGVLVPDGDKFYGINPEEFKATHNIVEKNKVLDNIQKIRQDLEQSNITTSTLKL